MNLSPQLLEPEVMLPDLDMRPGCQFGVQDILSDALCVLECNHDPMDSWEEPCPKEADWMQVLHCCASQTLLCNYHASLIQHRVDKARRGNGALDCFHCGQQFMDSYHRI